MKLKLFRRFLVECTCERRNEKAHTHHKPTGKMKRVVLPFPLQSEIPGVKRDEATGEYYAEVPETVEVEVNGGVPLISMHEIESDDNTIRYGGHCTRCDENVECVVTMTEAGTRRAAEVPSDGDQRAEAAPAVLPS